jgi:hypothetical protein
LLNTAVGTGALIGDSSGSDNTASGSGALHGNTTGNNNTASGTQALASNAGGSNNTASGAGALQGNTSGADNTATGYFALSNTTSGYENTAIGFEALQGTTIGAQNTAVGGMALIDATGNSNIALGYFAGYLVQAGNNNIEIGSQGSASDSGVIRIGTATRQTSTYIAGITGVTTGASASQVVIDANGQLGTISSSRRYKEDIETMGDVSEPILKLRPVTFRYKKPNAKGEKPLQYGLIAEEVAKVLPELVVTNNEGQPETVAYQTLPVLLLNELQKEHAKVERQAADLRQAEKLVREQGLELAALKSQMTEVDSLRAELVELRRLTEQLAARPASGDSADKLVAQASTDK